MTERYDIADEYEPVVHCWEDGPEGEWDGQSGSLPTTSTCFLLDGHEGPHEWTPDGEILIDFKGAQ